MGQARRLVVVFPPQPVPDNKAKLFGSAAHVLLLEGVEEFALRYAVEPDPRAFPDLIRTTDDILAALDMGGHPLPQAKARKPQIIEHAKVFLADRHIWDDILERRPLGAGRDARGRDGR